jgi:chemotaxis protein methyltransferase CheR
MRAASNAVVADALEEGYAFSSADFERVRTLIYRHAGIALNPSKRSMVYSRLSRRLRHREYKDFRSYLDALEATPAGSGEWQDFINALTTNLTYFYRESHHFPILARHLQRPGAAATQSLWCCAASTGEEPCSIAITAMQALGSRQPPVRLLATDIDTNVLAKARAGVFGDDAASKLEPSLLKQYFLRGRGSNEGMVRVHPDVQALIDYRPLNLLDSQWPIDGQFDAIFCRNVMIYFDRETQLQVLRGLAARLKPDGLLFAGHSENFTHARELLELQGHTVYTLPAARR